MSTVGIGSIHECWLDTGRKDHLIELTSLVTGGHLVLSIVDQKHSSRQEVPINGGRSLVVVADRI